MKTQIWKKLTQKEIKERIFGALDNNVHYNSSNIIGIPASHLDEKVFNQDASFLAESPFMSTMVQNPNHIGCHTTGTSESFFAGTQSIERELIEMCAVDILKAEKGTCDGYVAAGGTEANLQAIWIYRNYFQQELGLKLDQIAILTSSDAHYSMAKGGNIFAIPCYKVEVGENTRAVEKEVLLDTIHQMKSDGIQAVIVVANMMTTMFGSVDSIEVYAETLKHMNMEFKIHVDGAYGGFYFPFSVDNFQMGFNNKNVSSVTLDAHKMAQAPYGTGMFIIRKGLMKYANTQSASYVIGEDCTISGSRSGANAIAIWMILSKNGPHGWFEKVFILQKRTDWMCEKLDERGITYFRNKFSNIITINANQISADVVTEFGLVPDNHHNPKWYKIVIMDHVTIEKLDALLEGITNEELVAFR